MQALTVRPGRTGSAVITDIDEPFEADGPMLDQSTFVAGGYRRARRAGKLGWRTDPSTPTGNAMTEPSTQPQLCSQCTTRLDVRRVTTLQRSFARLGWPPI